MEQGRGGWAEQPGDRQEGGSDPVGSGTRQRHTPNHISLIGPDLPSYVNEDLQQL